MSTIHIHFNDQAKALPQGATLQQALAAFAGTALREGSPMASALNGRHIPRAAREYTGLSEGDRITTFEPITGG